MELRRIDKWILPLAAFAGLAISPGTISGDASRTLTTFLGLFSASVLPTISLLVNGMTASGRSVLALNDLEAELQAAMDAMFSLFGCVAVVMGALVALSVEPPAILSKVPYLTSEVLPRVGQGVVVLSSSFIILRVGILPAILRRTLEMRHKIAVDEAKRKNLEKAPTSADVLKAFPTHENFGKSINIDVTKQ